MSNEELSPDNTELVYQLADYKKRLQQLAAEKSELQLYADLINKLSVVKGLDNTAYQIVSLLMGTVGGIAITLYFSIDNVWYSMDAFRNKTVLDTAPERILLEAMEKRKFVLLDERKDTGVVGKREWSSFGQGSTFIIPLTVEDEAFGVIKMEGMLVARPDMMDQLKPFINYASLVLRGEIENYSELKLAYGNIKQINTRLIREIEDRKKAEDNLRESEQRFRSTFENAVVGMCITSVEGQFLMVNSAFREMLGYTEEEVLNRNFADFTHPEDLATSSEKIVLLLTGEIESAFFEKRYLQKSGNAIWALVGTTLLRDGHNRPKYFITHIEDVTSRKVAEEKLTVNEKKFRTFFEHVTDYALVLKHTEEGLIIVDMNESACEKHGYSREELIGKPITFLDAEPVPPDDERIKKIVEGDLFSFEATHKRVDGSTFPVEITAKLIDVEGEPFIFSIERDISDRKAMEEAKLVLESQLRQSLKMEAIGTLAGGIAHDFNNILSAILGYSEMASDSLPDYSPAKDQIRQVLQAGTRAKDLVQQILVFSRKESQQRIPIQIHLIVNEALKLLRATIPTTIEIRQSIDMACGSILAEPTQIHQVLMNICTNAAQAMDENGGVLEISLRKIDIAENSVQEGMKPGKYIELAVKDTGCGIAQAHLDRIFDPYFTTKEIGKGTGMGLAVVHGIVQSHDGKIAVESVVGQGTTMRLYFHRVKEAAQEQPVDAHPIPSGREHILLVDDEPSLAKLMQKRLEKLGYEVTAMTSSLKTLDLFVSDPTAFDLVITDQTMPDLTGDRLAQELLKIRPELPVIMCTGYSSRVDKEKARLLGIMAFIMKPVDNAELARTVRQALDFA